MVESIYMRPMTYAWTAATNNTTTSLSPGYMQFSVPVATPQEKKISAKEKKRMKKEEAKRRKEKKESYVGKFLTIPPQNGSFSTNDSFLCVKETEDSVYIISEEPQDNLHAPTRLVLDKTVPDHYIITDTDDDPELLKELADSISEQIMEISDERGYRKWARTYKQLFEVVGIVLPQRPKAKPNYPMLVNGQVILSRKMQATIRSQFCDEYQRKTTALMTEMCKEMLMLMAPLIREANIKELEAVVINDVQRSLPESLVARDNEVKLLEA